MYKIPIHENAFNNDISQISAILLQPQLIMDQILVKMSVTNKDLLILTRIKNSNMKNWPCFRYMS